MQHSLPDHLSAGFHHTLGAIPTVDGVNFALFSAHAQSVELLVFHEDGSFAKSWFLPERSGSIWHGHLNGARPGLLYSYKVHGPYNPDSGMRFDGTRLLLDPYAKAWSSDLSGLAKGIRPHCIVTAEPEKRNRPQCRHDHDKNVIYEAHVKGLTKLHPAIPKEIAGTYLALGHPAIIEHLLKLGITSLELLPLQGFADELFLHQKGLVNYWGYNPVGYFVVEPRYAHGPDPRAELMEAVDRLHEAGIEVILDVVYNHTAEGGKDGPSISFRGIDNPSYYQLAPDPSNYINDTGCGNTLACYMPFTARLILDSLRYWVEVIGVDGFRFDLATTLGRMPGGFDADCGLFQAIRQDPVLTRVKLIAEPWDIGPGGYQLGHFGHPFMEWNDRFRDTVRAFWRGDHHHTKHLAEALHGSASTFDHLGRKSWSSINFITAHDGFVLEDLVSYNDKHNELNLENNADGHGHNLSSNSGHEGPTDDPDIQARRASRKKSLLISLFCAQGTPMMLMGDELGNSQSGNNNAYCQDNEISWIEWEKSDKDLFIWMQKLICIRKMVPALNQKNFLHGETSPSSCRPNISWWHPQNRMMQTEDWWHCNAFGMHLEGSPQLLVLMNSSEEAVIFDIDPGRWMLMLSSRWQHADEMIETPCNASALKVSCSSAMILRSL